MAWTTTEDLQEFLTAAGGFLRARPDRNTVLLSVAASLKSMGPDVYGDRPPLYGWWRPADAAGGRVERRAEDGRLDGAFLWTPPYPAAVSPMPLDAAADLCELLAGRDPAPQGVRGHRPVAEAYAAAQALRQGVPWTVQSRERLFRLGTLSPPSPAPPGRARLATPEDRDLLLTWMAAFRRDADLPAADDARLLDSRITDGRLLLWEVGSEPVSMAGTAPATASSARVGPVYTPDAHRGRGYAGAATAAVSRAALDAGLTEVLLFTDLANSTSNALYQRLGYVPLEDHAVYGPTAVRAGAR